MPPLREHPEDILLLSEHFLKEFNGKYDKHLDLHDDVVKLFLADYWPGNVRELQNVIRHAVIMAKGSGITLDDLPPYFTNRFKDRKRSIEERASFPPEGFFPVNVDRDRFIKALKVSNNNRSKAMKILGISRGTFYKKYREYGLATAKDVNAEPPSVKH
jgi:DNA-binding NtrC family response regulator